MLSTTLESPFNRNKEDISRECAYLEIAMDTTLCDPPKSIQKLVHFTIVYILYVDNCKKIKNSDPKKYEKYTILYNKIIAATNLYLKINRKVDQIYNFNWDKSDCLDFPLLEAELLEILNSNESKAEMMLIYDLNELFEKLPESVQSTISNTKFWH